jgi:branched-chain amino acid transport system substrate-binding protein
MELSRRLFLSGSGAALVAPYVRPTQAQDAVIRIGVLNDQSGPYRDDTGIGSRICTEVAAAEFSAGKAIKVEVLSADHQNKPDVGAAIARQWFDRDGVDMIIDVPTSSVALAVNSICREKNKVFINSGAATTALTGKQCTPNTVHFTYDTYMLARSTGRNTVKAGGDSWYFVTADYVFGHELESMTSHFVTEAKGRVLGRSVYPFPGTTDFSSFLLAAQTSGAKVLGLANAGNDTINCIKQAHEFGLTPKMRVAALLMGVIDVHGVGLEQAQGLLLTESFYWDLNERTRRFTAKVRQALGGRVPNMIQAGCYAGTLHYLKAVADIGLSTAKADGAAVVARMKAMPTEDDVFGKGRIRADGQLLVPVYLFEVKKPQESSGEWDYYKMVAETPADEAWQPVDKACPLVRA